MESDWPNSLSEHSEPSPAPRRRLVALMFTDMVGYSALASKDERMAFELLEEHRSLLRRVFPAYGGRENKTVGDAFFIEFGSAVEAVQCAVEIQTVIYDRNISAPKDLKLQVRIGLHLGDIIDFDGDAYGDGVNIASRVESKARPGGVFLTRQIYDQVAQSIEFPIRRVGTFKLKNIATPTDLYRVKFPWEAEETRTWAASIARTLKGAWYRRRLSMTRANPVELWKMRIATLLFSGVTAALAVGLALAFHSNLAKPSFPGGALQRAPAGDSPPQKIELLDHWVYSADFKHWKSFDPRVPWNYSDQIQGKYWLKTEFELNRRIETPAIVLGLISGVYRVFLNGHFIGGANYFASLEYYTFDPEVLNPRGKNTLVVVAESNRTTNPGLTSLPAIGSYLGEFDQVHGAVFMNRITFDVFRSVYLALAFVISLVCMIYYLTRRSRIEYLYFSLYLLLGAMALTYYNTIFASFVDYRYRRFLKLFTLVVSSFVLFSAYLNLKKNRIWELGNNLGAVVAAAAVAWLLLTENSPGAYRVKYNGILWGTLAYTALWLGLGSGQLAREFWKDLRDGKGVPGGSGKSQQLTTLFFGGVTVLMTFTSLKWGNEALSRELRTTIQDFGMAYPFIFALVVLVAGIRDHLRKSMAVSFSEQRNSFILNLVRIVNQSGKLDAERAVAEIQQKVCEFVGAERSTIYLLEKQGAEDWLKAKVIYGQMHAHLVEHFKAPRDGIIGYVCTSRAPLLIRDLAADLRFSQYLKKSTAPNTYKTGSCMIFPLLSGGELIGVLTVADKFGGSEFSRHDFALLHVVAKDLGLIIENARLRARVESQFAA